MTTEYGHAIVMAKLRHCAKFRCTGVLRRLVDGVFGRAAEKEHSREREKKRGRGVPGEKGGQKSERPNQPGPGAESERKKENVTAPAAETGRTVCCATGSGSSCRRHRK